MIVVYGTRAYGVVEREDGAIDATRFFHLFYLPLVPIGSAAEGRSLAWASLLLGYARAWGLVAFVATLVAAVGGLDHAVTRGAALAATLPVLLVGWLVAALWLVAGRRRNRPRTVGRTMLLAAGVLVPLALFTLGTLAGFDDLPRNRARLAASR